MPYAADAVHGSLDEPEVLSFGTLTGVTEMQTLMGVYPNPVDRNEPFTLSIPEGETVTEVLMVNAMGETVMHRTGMMEPSMAHGLPTAGVYMLKVVCKSGNVYQGRLVVK